MSMEDTFGRPLSPSYARLTTPNSRFPPGDPTPRPGDFGEWLKSTRSRARKYTVEELEELALRLSEVGRPFGDGEEGTPKGGGAAAGGGSPARSQLMTRTLRGDPAKGKRVMIMRVKRSTGQIDTPPIPGYTGHRPGAICKEIVRVTCGSDEERSMHQDLSLSLGMSMSRNDVSTFSPQVTMGNSLLAESAYLSRKPVFQLSEKAFQSKTSDFILHQMRTMKFERGKSGKNHFARRIKSKKASHGVGSPVSVVSVSTASGIRRKK